MLYLEQCCPIELFEVTEMSHIDTVKCSGHLPLDSTEPECPFFSEVENIINAEQILPKQGLLSQFRGPTPLLYPLSCT